MLCVYLVCLSIPCMSPQRSVSLSFLAGSQLPKRSLAQTRGSIHRGQMNQQMHEGMTLSFKKITNSMSELMVTFSDINITTLRSGEGLFRALKKIYPKSMALLCFYSKWPTLGNSSGAHGQERVGQAVLCPCDGLLSMKKKKKGYKPGVISNAVVKGGSQAPASCLPASIRRSRTGKTHLGC